jgi:hypothetical protein
LATEGCRSLSALTSIHAISSQSTGNGMDPAPAAMRSSPASLPYCLPYCLPSPTTSHDIPRPPDQTLFLASSFSFCCHLHCRLIAECTAHGSMVNAGPPRHTAPWSMVDPKRAPPTIHLYGGRSDPSPAAAAEAEEFPSRAVAKAERLHPLKSAPRPRKGDRSAVAVSPLGFLPIGAAAGLVSLPPSCPSPKPGRCRRNWTSPPHTAGI